MKKTLAVLALVAGCEFEGGLLGEITARPECSPGSLEFAAVEGTGTLAAQDIVLTNTGDEPAPFALEDDANWLALSSYAATSDGPNDDVTVQVTPDTTGLSPGVYTATVRVRSGAWEKAVAVELCVAAGGSNVIYVSIDGDDTTGDGSFDNPYRTVTKGVFELSPPGKDTVYILPSDQAYTTGETFPIALKDATAVTAPSAQYVELRGDGAERVFAASGVTCTLSGLTVSQGSVDFGGGLFVTGASVVTVTDCIFEDCTATNNGGAVRVAAGSASFSGCVFRRNSAAADGGAVSDAAGSTYVECVFENNIAGGEGGGIGSAGGQFTRCIFSGNSATSGNGGACFLGGAATLQDCVLDSNAAATNGGAIYAAGGALTADGLLVLSNSAVNAGGGTYVSGGGTIDNSMIDSNSAQDGAGIYANSSISIGTSGACGVVNNVASGSGGGVYFAAGGVIADSTVESNAATDGAGIYAVSAGAFIGTGGACSILNNTATGSGGGVYISGGGSIFNNTVDSNTADVGGGIYVTSTRIAIGVSSISYNTANVSGGGLVFDSAIGVPASMCHDCDISYNTAADKGGGVYVAGASNIAMGPHYIVGNSAASGGGVYVENGDMAGSNTEFFQNNLVALNQGGGVWYAAGSLDVESCTIVDNVGAGLKDTSMAAVGLVVVNSIFWGNGDELDGVLDADVSYCDIEDNDDLFDPTVLHADPSFVDRPGGDYRLTVGSPCIDKGLNGAASWPTDLDGNARIVNGVVDMGCYEYQ